MLIANGLQNTETRELDTLQQNLSLTSVELYVVHKNETKFVLNILYLDLC